MRLACGRRGRSAVARPRPAARPRGCSGGRKHAEIARGDPAEVIVATAARINADMILLSTHRKAGVKAIGTDMFERLKEEGLLNSPDEPARLVLFLASRAGDGITGEFLSFEDKEVKFLLSQG